jgi:hypothetical protein
MVCPHFLTASREAPCRLWQSLQIPFVAYPPALPAQIVKAKSLLSCGLRTACPAEKASPGGDIDFALGTRRFARVGDPCVEVEARIVALHSGPGWRDIVEAPLQVLPYTFVQTVHRVAPRALRLHSLSRLVNRVSKVHVVRVTHVCDVSRPLYS